ncbi:MAG: hypothetical protein V4675_01310 [Verrucomicrobiota bacterium]
MKLPIPGPQNSSLWLSGITTGPHPSLPGTLEMEIPMHRIARRINDMIEATRETSFGQIESDWITVEAGLRLYLEFTKHTSFPGISLPPLPAQTRGEAAAVSPTGLQLKPNSRKQLLTRRLEDADTLKNFMTCTRSMAVADEASLWEKDGAEFSMPRWQRRPASPDPEASSEPAPVNRSAPWLSMLSALTIAGFVLGVAFLSPKAESAQKDHHSLRQMAETSEVLPAEIHPPAVKDNSSVPSGPPPAGWPSRKDYDEWSPKFEVSLLPE